MMYAMVSEEGFVSWLDEENALIAGGYGHNTYIVEEVPAAPGKGLSYKIECPVWYSSEGKFEMEVTHMTKTQAILIADAAVRKAAEYA